MNYLTITISGPTEPVERAIRNLRAVLDVISETTQSDSAQPPRGITDPHLHKTLIIAAETTSRLNIKITAEKEHQQCSKKSHSTKSSLGDTSPGNNSTWAAMDWKDYIAQKEPWNWADWPLPWNVRPADTSPLPDLEGLPVSEPHTGN